MDRCFPKFLRGYISKRKNLSVLSKLSVKINPATCFLYSIGPGNGGGGVYFFNHSLFTVAGPHGGGGGVYDMVMVFGPNGGGGGSGSHLYNKLIPNFKIKVKR